MKPERGSSPVGLAVLDRDGVVLDANPTLVRWTGLGRDDVVGQPLSALLRVGSRIYWGTHVGPLLLLEGRIQEVLLELRTPDGRRPVLVYAEAGMDEVQVALAPAEDRTRFERELIAARSSADRAATRLGQLQEATAALSRSVTPADVATAVLAAVARSGAVEATVWLRNENGTTEAASINRTVPVPSEDRGVEGSGVEGSGVEGSGVEGSGVGDPLRVPLTGATADHGRLVVERARDAGADPADEEFLQALALQAGSTLDRVRLYLDAQRVAADLQRAMLQIEVPSDPRLRIESLYRPGVRGLQVGGDWFDVLRIDDDVVTLVVGDVVGRGLRAAGAMGQLRSAVRALAVGSEAPSTPSALLTALDRYAERVPGAELATVVIASLDLAAGRVRYSCAGHLPPLVVPADGPATLAWSGRATPLAAPLPNGARTDGELVLAPGDQLVLYTDGLVEQRGRRILAGLVALTDAADGAPPSSSSSLIESLALTMLGAEGSPDDVCLLAATWTGA